MLFPPSIPRRAEQAAVPGENQPLRAPCYRYDAGSPRRQDAYLANRIFLARELLPRAADLPAIETTLKGIPTRNNALGVKGAGEAGTTAAIAAVMNAFADAIPGSGKSIQMPATPEKVWKACQEMAG